VTWRLLSPLKPARHSTGLANLRQEAVYEELLETIREQGSGRRILYAPNVGNWGDGLIHAGTVQFLRDNGVEFTQVTRGKFSSIRKALDGTGLRLENTLLISGGGGSFCQAWSGSRNFLDQHAVLFDHVVLMPSTFELPPLEVGPDRITYFARDRFNSQAYVPSSRFCHDMAFYLQLDGFDAPPTIDEGYFFREDKERHAQSKTPPGNLDLSMLGNHTQPAKPFFQILANYRKIFTDRMHVAIAGSLLGREVILYPGSYHKSADVFQSSIADNYPDTALASWG
jgi:exopolysaccharide biosynthesis predicted pyruvyltransferase EpsI